MTSLYFTCFLWTYHTKYIAEGVLPASRVCWLCVSVNHHFVVVCRLFLRMAAVPPGCPQVCGVGHCVQPTEPPQWDGFRRCYRNSSLCAFVVFDFFEIMNVSECLCRFTGGSFPFCMLHLCEMQPAFWVTKCIMMGTTSAGYPRRSHHHCFFDPCLDSKINIQMPKVS